MSLQQVGSSDSFSQLGCHIPSQLQTVSAGAHLSAPLQFFSPSAISWRGCSQSALLHSVNSFAALPALCQLSCILSAQLQSICSSVFCHLLWQTSCKTSAQLWSARSFAICHLSCSLSSQSWYVSLAAVCQLQSVSSAATGVAQLRCVSAQLRCYQKAQLQLVNSAVRSAATCQLSCTLLAQMTLIISAAMCWKSWSLSPHLDYGSSPAVC